MAKDRLKIINIGLPELPTNKANGVSLTQTCNALSNLGNDCTIIVPSYSKKFVLEDVREYYKLNQALEILSIKVPNLPGRLFIFSILAALKAKALRPDFVFGRNIVSLSLVSMLTKVPFAFEIHSAIWTNKRLKSFLFNRQIKKRSCVGIITNSLGLKRKYISTTLYENQVVQVAENGSNEIENHLLTEPENPRLQVGYFGSYFGGRGASTIIDVARQALEFDFNVYGVSLEQVLNQGIKNIPSNLTFHGYVKYSLIDKLRADCNILLAPYSDKVITRSGENTASVLSPVKLFEYMASKRVIIATELPTIRDVLDESMAVFVKPNCSVYEWVTAIRSMSNKKLRHEFAQNAYQAFQQKYTWNHRAKKIVQLIK